MEVIGQSFLAESVEYRNKSIQKDYTLEYHGFIIPLYMISEQNQRS